MKVPTILGRVLAIFLLLAGQGAPAQQSGEWPLHTGGTDLDAAWIARREEMLRQLPPPQMHFEGNSEETLRLRRSVNLDHARRLQEALTGGWFAALRSEEGADYAWRFATWRQMVEFLGDRKALIEVWARGEGSNERARRIPATQLGEFQAGSPEMPRVLTASFEDPITGVAARYRLEFGFQSARQALGLRESYQQHRQLQLCAHEILSARTAAGRIDGIAQWRALRAALQTGRIQLAQMPKAPADEKDLLVAFELETDEYGNYRRAVTAYRAREIGRAIFKGSQCLTLTQGKQVRRVFAFEHRLGGWGELERVPNPRPGQDSVELRIERVDVAKAEEWPVLDFGEPELLREAALADFALVNAYLDRHRKKQALRQSDIALIVEPILAGLNVGGGIAGLGFPLGAAVRLGYDVAIVPWLIADVPSAKQMRELLRLAAARTADPALASKPGRFLERGDLQRLRGALGHLTEAEVQAFIDQMTDEDLNAMLQIARLQRWDAKLVNLLSIISDAGRVSGWTDEEGWQRDVFNNIYVSMSGEVSLNYILAVLAGAKGVTPLSGVSLYDLSRGKGPAEAWLQYFNFTVDLRAILNTLERLSHRRLDRKELQKPFPYAPRMSDLAAYEFRVFGFPTLMFYKRGLIRDDLRAYEHDYAYGLLGTKIVEYFPERADLEAEIAAGRLTPLGYVRVLDAKGGWRDTRLAVFAHRIPAGKHEGKTALVIYGLKAYREQSEMVARERARLQEYERGLHEGAVIEQWRGGETGATRSRPGFEPTIYVGPLAAAERYKPVLGCLLELRRFWALRQLGLSQTKEDEDGARNARFRLRQLGIEVPEGDPIVDLDPFHSTFSYYRKLDGEWRVMRVNLIPGMEQVERDLAAAAEAKSIEEFRSELAAGKRAGIVLLNEAVAANGQWLIGPPLTNAQGRVLGAGVRVEEAEVARTLAALERLPVVDRARLEFNQYAATLLDLDCDESGQTRRVFLTIEFPPGETSRTTGHPLTREDEIRVYRGGALRQVIAARRIMELERDDLGLEIASRTYVNAGTLQIPVRGKPLEETRTLEHWCRNLESDPIDPYAPILSKVRINYVTGTTHRETYGLFPLPLQVNDELTVTTNQYTPQGHFQAAVVWENEAASDSLLQRVVAPVPGRERYRVRALSGSNGVAPGSTIQTRERSDLVLGVTRTETIDVAHAGRVVQQSTAEVDPDGQASSSKTEFFYEEDFCHGLLPAQTLTVSLPSGTPLVERKTVGFDPMTRRLTAVERDHTGGERIVISEGEKLVEVASAMRRTLICNDRDGSSFESQTEDLANGEVLETATGQFDTESRTFRVVRSRWHGPGILQARFEEDHSPGGRLLKLREAGGRFRTLVDYGTDGRESARRVFRPDENGQFEVPHRVEDDYAWAQGRREARIRTWLEGQPWDEYDVVYDTEGRLARDGIRSWGSVRLETRITYQSASDRVLGTELLQNDRTRAIERMIGEEVAPDGSVVLVFRKEPSWGLAKTNRYQVGSALARPLAVEFEDGRRFSWLEWFTDTTVARRTRTLSGSARTVHESVLKPGAGQWQGLPYDEVWRYNVSPWGETALAERRAVLRGTDVPLFSEVNGFRTHYDMTCPYEAVLWAEPCRGTNGIRLMLAGALQTNVAAVYGHRFRDLAGEKLMEETRVDVSGGFFPRVSRSLRDRAGAVVEESFGSVPLTGGDIMVGERLLVATDGVRPIRKYVYRYEPGWLVESKSETGTVTCVYTTALPDAGLRFWAVNENGWRDWATEVVGLQAKTEGDLEAEGANQYVYRRWDRPRWLKQNPYQPTLTNVWIEWAGAELNPEGKTVYTFRLIQNGEGAMATRQTHHVNRSGRPAERVTYHLPRVRDGDDAQLVTSEVGPVGLKLSGACDLSRCDFVALCVQSEDEPKINLLVRDHSGRTAVFATRSEPGEQQAAERFWPTDREVVQWLPDQMNPERGVEVITEVGNEGWLVVPISALVRAGLAVNKVASVEVRIEAEPGRRFRVSPLLQLGNTHRRIEPRVSTKFRLTRVVHASGLQSLGRTNLNSSREERRERRDSEYLVQIRGHTVGTLRASAEAPYYDVLRLVDTSDAEFARPLYSLAAEDGRFLEYYQTIRAGDAQTYTVAGGFATPKLEVNRGAVLEDQISPGVLAFGREYDITIPLSRPLGGAMRPLARFQDRCMASVFTLASERALERLGFGRTRRTEIRRLTTELGPADAQAAAVNRLPTLAETLLSSRPLPWKSESESLLGEAPRVNGSRLKIELRNLAALYPVTGLVPTSPGTEVERYVETVREARLIELAIRLGDVRLGREILEFYQRKSRNGTRRLFAFYDASTGASLQKRTGDNRSSGAAATAEAQVAIAGAAFSLGAATGNREAFVFGQNLVTLLLREFRSESQDEPRPRGLAELPVRDPLDFHGVNLWPTPRTYPLRSNARAYLLFRRAEALGQVYPFEKAWSQEVALAGNELAEWFHQRILPGAEASGVVTRGLFELQDVHTETRAVAGEKWTSTEDWLLFLEAAQRMGVSSQLTHRWLENLARVHGVTAEGAWGLDWGLALSRPDAISPELTATFGHVASLLGHTRAEHYAWSNLEKLRQEDRWPRVISVPRPAGRLSSGQGFDLYPTESEGTSARWTQTVSGWPEDMGMYVGLLDAAKTPEQGGESLPVEVAPEAGDVGEFLWLAAGFYASVLVTASFWWLLSVLRRRRRARAQSREPLVPLPVQLRAEERWAKRVLGVRIPAGAPHSRYSNAPVEQNFHMQLRAIYKLVLEWRRLALGWAEDDERLALAEDDLWLNGLDEFAAMVGIYCRWVVKAGQKDGFSRKDVLEEHEDSNHIWSRMVMYFSEWHLALLGQLADYKSHPQLGAAVGLGEQIELVLRTLGVRERMAPFDARLAFEAPAQADAFDLLEMQLPGATLRRLVGQMDRNLGIPRRHFTDFVRGYKSFKRRETVDPVHPYLLEFAKLLPHFVLMGLVSLIWFNDELGGLEVVPALKEVGLQMALDWPLCLSWILPLGVGLCLTAAAYLLEVYRYRWSSLAAHRPDVMVDATLSSLFARGGRTVTPAIRPGQKWNPRVYREAGWVFRAMGLVFLVGAIVRVEAPSFTTFMFLKGVCGAILMLEAGGILVPLGLSAWSKWVEDRTGSEKAWKGWRLLNQLNIASTRPASLLWLSFRYHYQPSVPTGGVLPMVHAILFCVVFGTAFFCLGGYVHQQALQLWFQETYRSGQDLRLIVGAIVFWNTIYLLRFGIFVLFAAVSSALARYPLRTAGAISAMAVAGLQLAGAEFVGRWGSHPVWLGLGLLAAVGLMVYEPVVIAALKKTGPWRRFERRKRSREEEAIDCLRLDRGRALGLVYMSGDDLSALKLTPEVLMIRVRTLREQLNSEGLRLVMEACCPGVGDDELERQFAALHQLETRHQVTLWHPSQLAVREQTPALPPELGMNLEVEDARARAGTLRIWHLRRWLVTMMSTAGHSQDTGINLVDLALRLAAEGLGGSTVFYLIQNKYDDRADNRPCQANYQVGELGQREKLARLLEWLAPGSRAYSIYNWTPFGFKAGGLVGMDLIHEESSKLTNMLVLDRNANAHDLDSVAADLRLALSDPGVVIVIPGRSTTNTLTPIGQSSQLIEEGQRAWTRGVMLLGGASAETLGTGWGNIQAVYYGRVQRAMCNPRTEFMPLTTLGRRTATFGERFEGLIGFGPHAVGISEDIWGVTQAAHNAVALGYRPKFRRSRTMWHKMRETWSHAEWFSAFPRWSGGYLQMMQDPLMQRINDDGPVSVFAKELRASGGRFFLGAPAALLGILLMPLAILWDASPFVQILILLWNAGLLMNQVLTALGLVACLESKGFNRASAFVGLAAAGIGAATLERLQPFFVPLVILGCLGGGFAMGLGPWLYHRGRDIILFGPQLVIHALGQMVRQSLEFVLSGASGTDAQGVNIAFRSWAGPREDRPADQYHNPVNLRSVVWGVGLGSMALNLFALTQLDFLNVLLLLPSLLFSVSTLVGPFVMSPKGGRHLRGWTFLPKSLGWAASFGFHCTLAWLLARGGWQFWLALVLGTLCFGALGAWAMRYLGYQRKLRQEVHRLGVEVSGSEPPGSKDIQIARHVLFTLGGNPGSISSFLENSGIQPEAIRRVQTRLEHKSIPLLRRPVKVAAARTGGRFACEFRRSFVLGLFTFVWFLIVPIPGLLVLTGQGGYRATVSLGGVLWVVGGLVAIGLLGLAAATVLERMELGRGLRRGLWARATEQYRRFFTTKLAEEAHTPLRTASLYALFTDLQTYLDQRGYGYARETLERIELKLEESRVQRTGRNIT